jgi:hypothetical protein
MDPSLNATMTMDPASVHLSALPNELPTQNDHVTAISEPSDLPNDIATDNAISGEGFIIDTNGKDPNMLAAADHLVQISHQNPLASSNSAPNEVIAPETNTEPAASLAAEAVNVPRQNDNSTAQTIPPTNNFASTGAVDPIVNASLAAPDPASPSGGVDFAALLSTLSQPVQSVPQTQTSSSESQPTVKSTLPSVPINASLPPRPDIQAPVGFNQDQSKAFLAQNAIPAPILTTGANGLPPPPSASFQHGIPGYPLPSPSLSQPGNANDDDGPFPPELEHPYEEFLQEERQNVTEAKWERFPDGSRLFIGKSSMCQFICGERILT